MEITNQSIADALGVEVKEVETWLENQIGIPKHRFDDVNEKYKQVSEQLKERDKQIESLKKVDDDNDALKQRIDEIQAQNKETEKQYKASLQTLMLDGQVKEALLKAKAKNIPAARANLDMNALKWEGDTVVGLNEQIEKLKSDEATSFLFESEAPQIGAFKPVEGSGTPTETDPFILGYRSNHIGG